MKRYTPQVEIGAGHPLTMRGCPAFSSRGHLLDRHRRESLSVAGDGPPPPRISVRGRDCDELDDCPPHPQCAENPPSLALLRFAWVGSCELTVENPVRSHGADPRGVARTRPNRLSARRPDQRFRATVQTPDGTHPLVCTARLCTLQTLFGRGLYTGVLDVVGFVHWQLCSRGTLYTDCGRHCTNPLQNVPPSVQSPCRSGRHCANPRRNDTSSVQSPAASPGAAPHRSLRTSLIISTGPGIVRKPPISYPPEKSARKERPTSFGEAIEDNAPGTFPFLWTTPAPPCLHFGNVPGAPGSALN